METRVKEHLIQHCKNNDWTFDDDGIKEVLWEAAEVWSGDDDEHRHWIEYSAVVEIDEMFIMITKAKGAGDCGIWDAGWEFDASDAHEVVSKEVKTTIYVPKEV